MCKYIVLVFLFISSVGWSQDVKEVLTLEEYIGYVKKYHPIVKQAQLITTESEAKLLKARGAFDPKVEVDYDRKKFKSTEYYDKLNSTFKIPTWYGVELKANYENNEGEYLNPENNVPENGLYSAGVSVSLAKGFLINKRMATLKQAKLYIQQAKANQQLVINEIVYDAITTYFNWLKNYKALTTYENYLLNANVRLQNVKKSFYAGDKPAIDTLEANINLKNRRLDLEKARIGYIKSKLELSNFLWLENNIPLELKEEIHPDINTVHKIDLVLNNSLLGTTEEAITNHPKIKELQIKQKILTVDKQLKTNNLLPKIELQYNFITSQYDDFTSLTTSNYKTGLRISFPLFLRKERGDLRLANLKLKEIAFNLTATQLSLKNKIESTLQEIDSYENQYYLLKDIVTDYEQLVASEERIFGLGEGSLFLVNYREVKLIEAQLKAIDTEYQVFVSKAMLLRILGNL